ncbi:MAG TPA: hypothetical protein VLD57_01850 [Blastocatellia bacterium]|nr:hypothetical protein [Blastocatellia bacterium]
MMIIRTISILLFALGLTAAAINPNVHAATGAQDGPAQMSSIAPPFITPNKESFTVREGDTLVIVANATCIAQGEESSMFEFFSSTPEFVRLSPVYQSENKEKEYVSGLAVINVTPQIGDAGKYEVRLLVRACNGQVERVITFQVKVKKAK